MTLAPDVDRCFTRPSSQAKTVHFMFCFVDFQARGVRRVFVVTEMITCLLGR